MCYLFHGKRISNWKFVISIVSKLVCVICKPCCLFILTYKFKYIHTCFVLNARLQYVLQQTIKRGLGLGGMLALSGGFSFLISVTGVFEAWFMMSII